MYKYLIWLCVSVSAFGFESASSGTRGRADHNDYQRASVEVSNRLEVSINDNLQNSYNALKSSQNDSLMGSLSSTAQRTLVLKSGTHTGPLVCDTDHVNVVSEDNNPLTTMILRAGGGAAVTQTCDTMVIQGLTIKNTGDSDGDYGLAINASDNSDSYYINCHFRQPNAEGEVSVDTGKMRAPVKGLSSIYGTWKWIEGDDYSLRTARHKDFAPTMWFSNLGLRSYGGDNDNNYVGGGEIGGTYYFCTAEGQSWGGCSVFGMDVRPETLFYFCDFGSGNSCGLGKICAATMIWCWGSGNVGGSCSSTYDGTFIGRAENCHFQGVGSFANKNASGQAGDQLGIIRNCIHGTLANYKAGTLSNRGATLPSGHKAFLYTKFDGDSQLKIEYDTAGTGGNAKSFLIVTSDVDLVAQESVGILTVAKRASDPNTVTELAAVINADEGTDWTATVLGDGTDEMPDTYSVQSLTYGVDADGFLYEGNFPPVPTACTSATTIYPFDSGHIYTNTGASAAVPFTAPPALVGLDFTVYDLENDAGDDVTIVPDTPSSESFRRLDGSTDGDDTLTADDDVPQFIHLHCYEEGVWDEVSSSRTWD